MPEKDYPHVNAAHINALTEEGSRDDLVQWLQKQWNEICYLREQLNEAYNDLRLNGT